MSLPTTNRSISDSYASSLSPSSSSPNPYNYNFISSPRERSPSPSRLRGADLSKYGPPNSSSSSLKRKSPSSRAAILRHIRPYITIRFITPFFIWIGIIWIIHNFIITLPLPKLSNNLIKNKNNNNNKGGNLISSSNHHLSTSFPQPPLRTGDDFLDSIDSRWRPFDPLPPPETPFPRLRPTRFLPSKCLEQWFLDGETLCGKDEMGKEETLDATWLWVNGSDHRWRDSMIHWRNLEGVYSPEHHFREQNELVHSMRSVLDALPGHLSTFHLILADYPFDPEKDIDLLPPSIIPDLEKSVNSRKSRHSRFNFLNETENSRSINSISPTLLTHLSKNWRIAQTPTWLDFSRRDKTNPSHPYHPFSSNQQKQGKEGKKNKLLKSELNYPTLRYASHSEIFHLPSLDRDGFTEELGEREWKEKEYRRKALPCFNSMAIESRVGWLPGLADVTLSLNDDFFLLRPHAVSDFHSPLYGSVIRFDHGYYQQVRPILDKNRFNDAGEVGGLYHANHLLSQRFPRRLRPYFAHVPKVITRGLHHEASLMFKEALAESSQRRFREMMLGEGDIQMQWLLTSLRVERWREALLWTYVVANLGTLGDSSDTWNDQARNELRDMFGLNENDDDVIKIEVHRGERWTLEPGRMSKVFEQVGWESPKATDFLFSSMDGHMPPILKSGMDPLTNDKCFLDLDRCFGSFWTREEDVPSADMFKRLTFQYPECGDCLIMALVTASGPLGLSAFFPPKGTNFENQEGEDNKNKYDNKHNNKHYSRYLPPPHLPLTPTWHEADFSLETIMSITSLPGEFVDLREFTMKLLSRYQYLSAKSVSHFHMLKSEEHANRVFKMIQENSKVSILGLNDDIEENYEKVKEIMQNWFELRWPKKAVWERDWDPIIDKLEE
ncbi:uncharacterized protein I206_102122 [Kwoniella pini CBS 10737]|uniref:3-O-alpha-D-mannopyranosyl-alpha-D-mannopyranose xylosylphosphotransferase n=1 Tax=Kwoniella pini CBS 10737 TaxID=1296096 RepID=A0A1B9HUR4_9TREE|nr:uncharacterized protein I206_06785 [Kwoniella pini CBS 10737]OCF47011.1 hypothetical protein I206_06785 [Kwoniella pini CBS 10737]